MSISLTAETQSRLQERAAQSGQDPSALAEEVLAAFLDDRVEIIPPGVQVIGDDDADTLAIAIAAGDDDFAAGRYQTLEDWRAQKRQQFGLSL